MDRDIKGFGIETEAKEIDFDEFGVLTPEHSKERLETRCPILCYVSTIYFPNNRIAVLAHLFPSSPIRTVAKTLKASRPHLENAECEYTVIDGMAHPLGPVQMANRDPAAISAYFPNAKPSPYHKCLFISTSSDYISINKNSGEVRVTNPKFQ